MKTKIWFITGASRGFGLEITKAALANGDKVVAAVRSQPDKLAATLNSEDLLVVSLDVTDEEQAQKAVKQAIDHFGRIDVLVNNAGFGLLGAVEEANEKEVLQSFETNVFGLLRVTRAALPYLRAQRSGHVINLSSVVGLTSTSGWGLYSSTKFAVEGISEALASELKPLGIHVTAVEPGFFRTNFLDGTSLATTASVIEDYNETSGQMRAFASQINYKQPGDPVKLAAAILKVTASDNPPVHLPLGNDTLFYFNQKMEKMNQELQDWHQVIISTDHDDVQK